MDNRHEKNRSINPSVSPRHVTTSTSGFTPLSSHTPHNSAHSVTPFTQSPITTSLSVKKEVITSHQMANRDRVPSEVRSVRQGESEVRSVRQGEMHAGSPRDRSGAQPISTQPHSGQPHSGQPLSPLPPHSSLRSDRELRLNILSLLTDPKLNSLFDITIVAEGKEFQAHKCILASASSYFQELFCSTDPPLRIEFQQSWVVVHQLLRLVYGAELDEEVEADVILEVYSEARNLDIPLITNGSIEPHLTHSLRLDNCLSLLLHEELPFHPAVHRLVSDFVAHNFMDLVRSAPHRHQLLHLSRQDMMSLIKEVSPSCSSNQHVETFVKLVVEWSQFDSACDLLRDCKQWAWTSERGDRDRESEFSQFMAVTEDPKGDQYGILSPDWTIENVKNRLCGPQNDKAIGTPGAVSSSLPVRYVVGRYCNWSVRLDHGAEGKIRLVYEAAVEVSEKKQRSCLQRFPAAMFAWQVIFRGNNVFHERPVFICFPKNVSLHWSTTLPITLNELRDSDSLSLICQMTENPLVSLILYHFSSDLSNTVNTEDILNRLPHIEYRCLSSYSLFQKRDSE
eukprot:GHVN01011416.1.p1 GENE.GHVN01011416.1~~GHVN01011416.1.p1  ORF type:complete len:566 (+),score=156.06 GHVN01011416.1:533-2230(+)